ncbi:hypothetical protein KQI42_00095 [Tissierella sp. MSJ-40]|uniref:Phage protein n=1 Tax=Tissierella simiarum TaxID=2841534 RepID=A0ABS6E2C2_9FIRM|nr:hypothetical protein [Tissierella simiarum]MBU5436388.1 hypothetical protein [Tissierella simiarum]
MKGITLNDLKKEIIKKIELFKDEDTKVYDGLVKEEFEKPCFFIENVKGNQAKQLGNRYKRKQIFKISYFPKQGDSISEEMLRVAETLYDELEHIRLEEITIMGQDMSYEIIDNVLHFSIDYTFYIVKENLEVPIMEKLYQKGEVKDDQ